MSAEDVVWELESQLRAVSSSVRKHGRAILTDFDMTPPQFDALVSVYDGDLLTMGDLSARLGLAYSTTTDLVNRLERRAFVERMRDVEDRRVVRVRLMQAGEEFIGRVMAARRAYLTRVLQHVSKVEQQSLLRTLNSLVTHLNAE